jgi:hypothetical protein
LSLSIRLELGFLSRSPLLLGARSPSLLGSTCEKNGGFAGSPGDERSVNRPGLGHEHGDLWYTQPRPRVIEWNSLYFWFWCISMFLFSSFGTSSCLDIDWIRINAECMIYVCFIFIGHVLLISQASHVSNIIVMLVLFFK